jgi:hypothetical protein
MIKPATYDGSGPWVDYHAHFEACSELSEWNYNPKGLFLAVPFEEAQKAYWVICQRGTKHDYQTLVKALEDRFEPPSLRELYRAQMRERRQRAGESFPELLGHSSACQFSVSKGAS